MPARLEITPDALLRQAILSAHYRMGGGKRFEKRVAPGLPSVTRGH